MQRRRRQALGPVIVLIVLSGGCRRVPSDEKEAGIVLYVASRVRTLDPARPLAEAIAVRGGHIVAVGSRRELERSLEPTRMRQLPGATIVPGLQDAHGHLASLGRSLSILNFVGTRSSDEVLALARKTPSSSFQGEWLIGRGWDQTRWPEGKREFPTRAMLDADFPNTPVLFTRVDGHAAWVNSEALRRAGVDHKTPDPPGGRILHDAKGEPTGVLIDNAMGLVEARVPRPSEEQLEQRLQAALNKCVEVGLTCVHDAGTDFASFLILQRWDGLGQLPMRLYLMANGQGEDAQTFLDRGPYQARFVIERAVKFWLDGALGSRGAALHAPYSDEPSQSGLLLMEPDELLRRSKVFMERGFQVAVHAIGDRANTLALNGLNKAAIETHTTDGRHRIEHAQILRLEDIPRFAKEKIIASMQPTHATSDMRWAEARVGKERIAGAYAWKSLLDSGAKLAFGSDFPVEDPNPLLGLYAARTRQDANGQPPGGWLPEQRLDGEQALRGFTTGAAYASFAEDSRGMLKAGYDADFVALSVDPVDCEPRELLTAKVLLTVVAGQPVYEAPVSSGR